MSKLKFVLKIAATLGVAFILSCSNAEDAVQQAQCTATQGEWNAATKQCESCPNGTTKLGDGQCVASAIQLADGTYICPARTSKNANGLCVADVIAIDPNAATGKYYCDYGKLDPLAYDTHDVCIEIEYQSQCDTWGKLVPSCQAKDRRTDIIYCDYGPADQWSDGGCYWVLSANDCDAEWGIIASKCGTHGKYPNGTVCPADKTKRPGVNECSTGDAGLTDGTATHCDWGEPHIEDGEVIGDCWPINDAETRQNCLKWGKGVNACPTYICPVGTARPTPGAACAITSTNPTPTPSNKYCFYGSADNCHQIGYGNLTVESCEGDYGMVVDDCNNVVLEYCDWGQPTFENGIVERGCWAIRNAKQRSDCQQWGTIRSSCPSYACPAGTAKNEDDGWGESGCIKL